MSAEEVEIQAPFAAPDVVWVKFTDSLPEGSIVCGQFDGEPVYAGRVYHNNNLVMGSVDLKKKLCTFSFNKVVHESSDFEIMTVPVGDPLGWEPFQSDTLELKKKQLLRVGKLQSGQILFIGRIVEQDNTYIGWVHPKEKQITIAKDGSEETSEEFELLIHKYLEFMCICPPCPRPRN